MNDGGHFFVGFVTTLVVAIGVVLAYVVTRTAIAPILSAFNQ